MRPRRSTGSTAPPARVPPQLSPALGQCALLHTPRLVWTLHPSREGIARASSMTCMPRMQGSRVMPLIKILVSSPCDRCGAKRPITQPRHGRQRVAAAGRGGAARASSASSVSRTSISATRACARRCSGGTRSASSTAAAAARAASHGSRRQRPARRVLRRRGALRA